MSMKLGNEIREVKGRKGEKERKKGGREEESEKANNNFLILTLHIVGNNDRQG